MTCEECLPALDDLVEGELAEAQAPQVMLHLGACASCARELELLERERRVLGEYIRAAVPSPRLGAAFREALAREPSRPALSLVGRLRGWIEGLTPRRPRLALALAVVATLVATATVATLRHGSGPPAPVGGAEQTADLGQERGGAPAGETSPAPDSDPSLSSRREESGVPPPAARRKSGPARRTQPRASPSVPEAARAHLVVERAELRYREAEAMLAQELDRRRARLDPAELVRLEADLGELDRVIASSRNAVHRDPTDAEAVRYMSDAYLAKITLLRRVTSD